jgi:hypothetical protein
MLPELLRRYGAYESRSQSTAELNAAACCCVYRFQSALNVAVERGGCSHGPWCRLHCASSTVAAQRYITYAFSSERRKSTNRFSA